MTLPPDVAKRIFTRWQNGEPYGTLAFEIGVSAITLRSWMRGGKMRPEQLEKVITFLDSTATHKGV